MNDNQMGEPVAHQPWCASMTRMLTSMPPKPAPCDCRTQCVNHGECFGGKCIYTTPQQRKPLTDEQITALEYATDTLDFPQTVRAIEAAHGIKE